LQEDVLETIEKINRILVSLFNEVLKAEEKSMRDRTSHNLSRTEVHTLVAIGMNGPKKMTEAANELQISVGTLTVAIDKLVRKGYVSRVRSEKDRRIVHIALTDSGRDVVHEHDMYHEEMVSEATSALNDEEMDQFAESIGKIADFFRKP